MDPDDPILKSGLLPGLPVSALESYRPSDPDLGTGELLPEEIPTLVDLPEGAQWPSPEKAHKVRPPEPRDADLDLDSRLGAGGFGSVWLGRQTGLERRVAVKCLRWDLLDGASLGKRRHLEELFRKEALTAASLEHPNIVPIYQVSRSTDGRLLLAMKRVRGTVWNDLILEDLDLPMEIFLARHIPILISISQAVAYAHAEGVLHRDIKPHQVLVGDFGEVMLTDWGLALRFQTARGEEPWGGELGKERRQISTAANPAGTPAFMAPEQTVPGIEQLGPWTDLYLLGGTLYYLLTGRPPHGTNSGSQAFASAARGEILPPLEKRRSQGLPPELEELALGALAPNLEDRRPTTVAAFTEALQEYLSGVSRQRRSQEIIERLAAREVPEGSPAYGFLNAQIEDLQQAENLWPANPHVVQQKERFLGLYSSTALSRGDLTLARLQAEQLPMGETRAGLLGKVEEREQRRRTATVQRRWALRGLLALGLILALGSVKYTVDQSRAQQRLIEQRDAARVARADTEELMSFMLEDVGERLIRLEKIEVLSPVVERAREYYRSRGEEELTPKEHLGRSTMLETLAFLLTLQGEQEQGIEVYSEAEGILEAAFQEASDPDVLAQLLGLRVQLGQNLSDLGLNQEALELLDEVQREARKALRRWPEKDGFSILLAEALDVAGVAIYNTGELEAAARIFLEAQGVLERVGEMGEVEDGEYLAFLEESILFHRAVVLNDMGQAEDALEMLDRSVVTGSDLSTLEGSPGDGFSNVFQVGLRGEILNNLGRHREALELVEQIRIFALGEIAREPANHEALYRYTFALEVAAAAYEGLGLLPKARQQWEETVRVLSPVGDSTDLLLIQGLLARALLKLGREDQAAPLVERLLEKNWNYRQFQGFVAHYGFEVSAAR
ncbi:MAG: serine/threonine protein kinase [Deltaproteobacteria bacterium]|nr:serine/threonine protein kinase [Deltaproteobacteria bacterium]